MPRSKHRRKPGGKAIKNPGRGRMTLPRVDPKMPWVAAFRRFHTSLLDAFREAFQDDTKVDVAHYLVDCITNAMFDSVELAVHPASKQEVFTAFTEPLEDEEPYTVEMAETTLTLLTERQLVVVEGDQISLHPRLSDATGTPPIEPE